MQGGFIHQVASGVQVAAWASINGGPWEFICTGAWEECALTAHGFSLGFREAGTGQTLVVSQGPADWSPASGCRMAYSVPEGAPDRYDRYSGPNCNPLCNAEVAEAFGIPLGDVI
jgi:hypothetical protein